MGTSVNVRRSYAAGVGPKSWIPLNRHSNGNYTLNMIVNGTATFDVEGTLIRVNRDDPVNADIFPITNLTALTADTTANIADTPLEAIRVNQTAGTGDVVFHVMQEGTI